MAERTKRLSQDELHSIVRKTIADSDAFHSREYGFDRVKATYYYAGQPHDKTRAPKPGRSSVVSRDVYTAVETMMPPLMRVFCSGDQIGQFVPYAPEDEVSAQEATSYINHLWFEASDGYRNTHDWLKAGLLYKFSICKVWWDATPIIEPERYEGIPKIEYQALQADPELDILSVEVYDDPAAGKVEEVVGGLAMGAVELLSTPKLYNVAAKRTRKQGKLAIAIVPPERFLFPRQATTLDALPTLTHREPVPVSDLVAQGYKRADLIELPDADDGEISEEKLARFESLEKYGLPPEEAADDETKSVWVNETYLRVDSDGDGIAEYRMVKTAGPQGEVFLDSTEVDNHPFISWSPILMPHRLVGGSIADAVIDTQEIKTALLRQMLDNVYQSNNATTVWNPMTVTAADVLNRVPGGNIRAKNVQDVRVLETTPIVAPSLQTLAYIDESSEQRTGLTRYNMGLDPNEAHNRTAAGVRQLSQAGRERIELVARNFGECGLRAAFEKILKLVKQHQVEPYSVYSNGRWLKGDPTIWRNDYKFCVQVGLGSQDKDLDMARLMTLLDVDQKIIAMQGSAQGPLVSLNNVYAKLHKLVIASGLKNPDLYYSNPANYQGPPPGGQGQPDPMVAALVAKTQGELQLEEMKAAHRMRLEELELDHSIKLERAKATFNAELEIVKTNAKIKAETVKQEGEMRLEQARTFGEIQRQAQKDAREVASEARP
jgi:hypothetical protein